MAIAAATAHQWTWVQMREVAPRVGTRTHRLPVAALLRYHWRQSSSSPCPQLTASTWVRSFLPQVPLASVAKGSVPRCLQHLEQNGFQNATFFSPSSAGAPGCQGKSERSQREASSRLGLSLCATSLLGNTGPPPG